jgi:hypothetical protein
MLLAYYTLIFIAIAGQLTYPSTITSSYLNSSMSPTSRAKRRVGNGFGTRSSWVRRAHTWSRYTWASPSWMMSSRGWVLVTCAILMMCGVG